MHFILAAQDSAKLKWELGSRIGQTFFLSDLHSKAGLGVDLVLGYKVSPNFKIRANISTSNCKGFKDSFVQLDKVNIDYFYQKTTRKNLAVKSNILATSVTANLDIMPSYLHAKNSSFYVFAGIGFFSVNSTLHYTDNRDSVYDFLSSQSNKLMANPAKGSKVEETYQGKHLYFPMGFYYQMHVQKRWSLSMNFIFNLTRNDLLDVLQPYAREYISYDHWVNLGFGIHYRL
jgi:hypothetical protein